MAVIGESVASQINVALVGMSAQGKSTLLGFLLRMQLEIPSRIMEHARQSAIHYNAPGQKFAFLVDRTPYERSTNKTNKSSWWGLFHRARRYLFIDTPGLPERLSYMAGALLMADVALCVVDIHEYLSHLKQHLNRSITQMLTEDTWFAQIYQKLALVYFYGVKRLVIALHKMDKIDFSEQGYLQAKSHLEQLLQAQGWKPERFWIVPTAIEVDTETEHNIINPSTQMRFRFRDPSLMQVLEQVPVERTTASSPLRMQVILEPQQQIRSIVGYECALTGAVLAGNISVEDHLQILPSQMRCQVQAITPIDGTYMMRGTDQRPHYQRASMGQIVRVSCRIVSHQGHNILAGEIASMEPSSLTLHSIIHVKLVTLDYGPHNTSLMLPLHGWLLLGYMVVGFRVTHMRTGHQATWQTIKQTDQLSWNLGSTWQLKLSLRRAIPIEISADTILNRVLLLDEHWQVGMGALILPQE